MIAFRLQLRAEDEDAATVALWELGTTGIEIQPAVAGRLSLLAYFSERASLAVELGAALAPLPGARMEPAALPQVDWVARFRESFRSFRVGGFHVAPPWDVPATPEGRLLLVDPGRAFGTGTHESTRLCLLMLEALAARGPLGRVLDVGTGAGILAVAAVLLGGGPVTGIDIDPDSMQSARRHARLNRVDVRLVQGDGGRPFASSSFDLILANLTAPLLAQRHEEIAALGASGAALVLSGLLVEDLPDIRAAYGPLGPLAVRTEGEWATAVIGGEGFP